MRLGEVLDFVGLVEGGFEFAGRFEFFGFGAERFIDGGGRVFFLVVGGLAAEVVGGEVGGAGDAGEFFYPAFLFVLAEEAGEVLFRVVLDEALDDVLVLGGEVGEGAAVVVT